jgi:hypothetical protein
MSPLDVRYYTINYDGTKFDPVSQQHPVQPFNGKREIPSPDIVPLTYVKNYEQIRSSLVERGSKLLGLRAPTRQYSTGATVMYHPHGIICTNAGRRHAVDGPVIVNVQEPARTDSGCSLDVGLTDTLEEYLREIANTSISTWKNRHGTF